MRSNLKRAHACPQRSGAATSAAAERLWAATEQQMSIRRAAQHSSSQLPVHTIMWAVLWAVCVWQLWRRYAVRPGSSRAKRRAAAAAVATQCGVRSNNQNSSPAAAERDSSACRAEACSGSAITCNHLACVRARAHSMMQNAICCVREVQLTSVNHNLHLTTGKTVEAAAAAAPRTVPAPRA